MDRYFRYETCLLTLILFLLVFPGDGNSKELLDTFDFALGAGYRVDQQDWNHTGSGGSPNIRSELTWENLEIFQLSNRMKLDWYETSLPVGFTLRSGVDYGWIYKGNNQDSDYNGDNRTDEFSRSNNNSDDGSVWDVSVSAGVTLFKNSQWLHLTPLVGYSFHRQNLTMTDGYQTINTDTGETGSFDELQWGELNSTYDSSWKGGFVGLEIVLELNEKFSFNSTLEFHDAKYSAEGDWNLRTDLNHPVSFTNVTDDASGVIVRGGILFAFTDTYLLTLNVDYKDWQAEGGGHTRYNSTGTKTLIGLNEANWQSYSGSVGIIIRYH